MKNILRSRNSVISSSFCSKDFELNKSQTFKQTAIKKNGFPRKPGFSKPYSDRVTFQMAFYMSFHNFHVPREKWKGKLEENCRDIISLSSKASSAAFIHVGHLKSSFLLSFLNGCQRHAKHE